MENRAKVEQYFARIGLRLPETVVCNGALLRQIQFAHCTTIPYENLDILRHKPLSLAQDDLFEKIVVQHRGGYCFELNGLCGWLLRQLGYGVVDCFARYLRGESEIPMRRHRVLLVQATDGRYLCDVGTGQICPRESLLLVEGLVQEQYGEAYRLEKDSFLGWVLMDFRDGRWQQVYSLTEEPQLDCDYRATSFFCENHPSSPFVGQELFSLKTPTGRITLDGHIFKKFDGQQVTVRELTDAQMPEAYACFGLAL